jgi:hypothetical protein
MCTTCPVNPNFPDFMAVIISGEECKLWSSSLFSFLQPPVTYSLLGPNPKHPLPNNRNMWQTKFHTHKNNVNFVQRTHTITSRPTRLTISVREQDTKWSHVTLTFILKAWHWRYHMVYNFTSRKLNLKLGFHISSIQIHRLSGFASMFQLYFDCKFFYLAISLSTKSFCKRN